MPARDHAAEFLPTPRHDPNASWQGHRGRPASTIKRILYSEGSEHQVCRSPGDKVLDIVDQLVGKGLLRLDARPGDMRRDDHVLMPRYAHQRTVGGRWLGQGDVDAGAADQPLV